MPFVTRPVVQTRSDAFGPMVDGHTPPSHQTRQESVVLPFDRSACRSAREWALHSDQCLADWHTDPFEEDATPDAIAEPTPTPIKPTTQTRYIPHGSEIAGEAHGVVFLRYDVLQVSNDGGVTWLDFATIRDCHDVAYAVALCDADGGTYGLYGHRNGLYRITTGGSAPILYPLS